MDKTKKQLKRIGYELKNLLNSGDITYEIYGDLTDMLDEAINYTHSCESDSELLKQKEKCKISA